MRVNIKILSFSRNKKFEKSHFASVFSIFFSKSFEGKILVVVSKEKIDKLRPIISSFGQVKSMQRETT